ncbi:MAG: glycosyltransferase family 2 protein [Methanobrevibacter sp.]|nr:glycosyltransferase family 2 protein [Methanobrevibacter sp.]
MKTAVLIPCYNESMTIKKVINDFQKALPDADIYVYDNNSTDGTDRIAKEEGAIVRYEYKQGKGNVVRSMFRDIDADCYIMVDGDDTYPAEAAIEIEKLVLEGKADMVIGDRLSSTYFTENKRPFHNSGNKFMRKAINTIFGSDLHDILTGMRGFSWEFVKSYPVISKGFELETEMSIFALDHNFKIAEIPIDYRDRMEGSESKLNTYSDGYKVIKVIITLFRDTKPLTFFSIITGILVIIALAYFVPILISYLYTGYVLRIPTLIMAATTFLVAVIIFLSGLILQVLKKQHDQNFEHQLTLIRLYKNRSD